MWNDLECEWTVEYFVIFKCGRVRWSIIETVVLDPPLCKGLYFSIYIYCFYYCISVAAVVLLRVAQVSGQSNTYVCYGGFTHSGRGQSHLLQSEFQLVFGIVVYMWRLRHLTYLTCVNVTSFVVSTPSHFHMDVNTFVYMYMRVYICA